MALRRLSAADTNDGIDAFQGGVDRKRCDTPRRGIGRVRHILDRHVEVRAISIDGYAMSISLKLRIRPNLDHRPVRADARESQRSRDVDIGGKSERRLPRISSMPSTVWKDRCGFQ